MKKATKAAIFVTAAAALYGAAAYGVTLEPSVVYWSVRPGENSVDRSNLGKK